MAHKLLLADDSVTIQKVIELTFADEDITVIAVGDGNQAIRDVVTERPDIVLADVGMPERDGYEVAEFIKNSPDLAHIPVLLLTGAFEPIDEGRARAARCDGVLVKPFEPQMVINRVKDLIAGRRPASLSPARISTASPSGRPASTANVDEYFDHLDAAFAAKEGPGMKPQAPRPDDITPTTAGLAEELANWPADPALIAPPAASASTSRIDPPAAAAVPAAPAAVPSATPPPANAPPTLAEAFAALLAAEQNQPHAVASINRNVLSDDLVEQVTRRVIERMGDTLARNIVLDVAERLVREEIDRIKQGR